MGGCDPITYHNITKNVFDSLKNTIVSAGIKVPEGNEGEIEGYGVKGHFKWDGASNLTVTVIDKPLVLPCGIITGRFNDAVQNAGGS
jgi:hypothetical protein